MIPTLITRSQICETSWNKLIEQSGQSIPYAFTFYLDLVCERWNALVWCRDDHYQIVMPLPVRRKAGKLLVYQPLFCQYLGIFSRSELTPFQGEAFLKALSRHFSYISAYHFNPENHQFLSKLESFSKDLQFKTNFTHRLDLQNDYAEICKGYSRDRQMNLKRARRANWEILKSDRLHPLIYLFCQNHAPKIPGGVNPSVYDRLEAIFDTMKLLDGAEVWYAHLDGIIRAGILVIRYHGKAVFLFNAADAVGRRKNGRTLLLDSYFSTFAAQALTFDFESPEVSSISNFYRSFGSETVPYLAVSKNKLWPPFRQLQNLRKRWAKTN